MQHDENWAEAENPEVEDAKAAFAEAQQAENLRNHIGQYAAGAVKYAGVDRDWVNNYLTRLGADPITAPAAYRLNIPITGMLGFTVTANSRGEALTVFNKYVAETAARGKTSNTVYGVEFPADAAPAFYSGPQDPPEPSGKVPGLDALKSGIRAMLKQGVTEKGWGLAYAVGALEAMGLEPLPETVHKTVRLPMSGVAELNVLTFEGDDEEAVQAAAVGAVARLGNISIKPDEIGQVMSPRPDASTAGFTLVDEDESL